MKEVTSVCPAYATVVRFLSISNRAASESIDLAGPLALAVWVKKQTIDEANRTKCTRGVG